MNLNDRAMLVNLNIRKWSAAKHDKQVSSEVAQAHSSDVSMGRYNKKLLSKAALEKINKIAGAARTEHYTRTLPWMDDGARIISSTGYPAYASAMRKHEDDYRHAVVQFVCGYPEYVRQAEIALNGLFKYSDYPSKDRIANLFSMGVNVLPVPEKEHFVVNLGNAEVARIRQEIEATSQALLADAMKSVWLRIQEVVSTMASKLRNYTPTVDGVTGIFRDSLVDNIRDLVDLLTTLNITDDPALDQFRQRMKETLLIFKPQELRDSTEGRNLVAEAAERILLDMSEFVA
jgi:hypothetical protein